MPGPGGNYAEMTTYVQGDGSGDPVEAPGEGQEQHQEPGCACGIGDGDAFRRLRVRHCDVGSPGWSSYLARGVGPDLLCAAKVRPATQRGRKL